MMTNSDLLKLRLAARTLIEWKTPVESKEYQRIFADLIKMHPNAATWGLTPDKDFLKLDERGTLLWYLSETLTVENEKRKERKYRQINNDQAIEFLKKVTSEGLIDYGFLDDAQKIVWSKGPTQFEVASIILAEIFIGNKNQSQLPESVYLCLLAILLPFNYQLQQKSIKNLWLSSDLVMILEYLKKSHLQIIFELVFRYYQSVTQISKIIASLFYAALPFIFISYLAHFIIKPRKQYDHIFVFLYEAPIEFLKLIYSIVDSGSIFFQLIALIVLLMICVLIGYFIFFSAYRQYNRIFDDLDDQIKSLWDKILNYPLKLVRKWIQRKINGVFFKRNIGLICAKETSILSSILGRNILDDWTQIALFQTRTATPDVAKEVLQLIRDPEINPSLKEEIFQWLCRVNLYNSQKLAK